MRHRSLIDDLEATLAIGALGDRPFPDLFAGFCERARAGGLSLSRASIGWPMLHPLFRTQNVVWDIRGRLETERFTHEGGQASDAYLRSPLRHILENDLVQFRGRLVDPAERMRFPVWQEFAADGHTDWVAVLVGFGPPGMVRGVGIERRPGRGVLISACSDAPDGFDDEDIAALERLKYMLALACRTSIQADMTSVLAATYLGRSAGGKVLDGQIERGKGEAVEAVIWYCDLRGSTPLCERLGTAGYIAFLNEYFAATAGPVIAHGGEVLDFIGDAVLAIFPFADGGVRRALAATDAALAGLESLRHARADVLGDRLTVADIAGIAIDTGTVIYGNIGVPERLAFSVIGATVNRVARIEEMTKRLREPLLVAATIARESPQIWRLTGRFALEGVGEEVVLFARAGDRPVSAPLAVAHG